ncbi:MAG TPA: NUDIX hydrolase [Actinomycetales bacterium]|nr:NUDIX hydrolase [Actinomycetales bacterium]
MNRPIPGPPRRSEPTTDAPAPVVEAAGAVCWRVRAELEVLVVHRPRYDDWSWPKGKLDPGEGIVAAAWREVEEETGLRVRLGIALPAARYRLTDSLDKHVSYWAAHVADDGLPPPPRPDEVDRSEWVGVAEARARLTRRGDRQQLSHLVDAHEAGCLDTWPLVILRHGVAHPRTIWGRDESVRPLVPAGLRQAAALVPVLQAWAPDRVVSSPWQRCTDTVRPYLEASGASLRTRGRLAEDAHRRDPAKVAALVDSLLDKGRPVLVCTHRPVLGTLLEALAVRAPSVADIPASDPFLAPGEALVAHVARRGGRVVAVERHRPERH